MRNLKLPAVIARSRGVSGYDKVLYAYLLSFPAIAECPNTRAISVACGMDAWTVRQSIRDLERAGLLKATRGPGDKKPRLKNIQVFRRKPRATSGRKKARKRKTRR